MPEIQNRCTQPECETGACSPEQVCPVYTNAIALSCKNILGDKVTGADITMLRYLNRGCTKPN